MEELINKILYGVQVANENVLVVNEKVEKILTMLEDSGIFSTFVPDKPKGESV